MERERGAHNTNIATRQSPTAETTTARPDTENSDGNNDEAPSGLSPVAAAAAAAASAYYYHPYNLWMQHFYGSSGGAAGAPQSSSSSSSPSSQQEQQQQQHYYYPLSATEYSCCDVMAPFDAFYTAASSPSSSSSPRHHHQRHHHRLDDSGTFPVDDEREGDPVAAEFIPPVATAAPRKTDATDADAVPSPVHVTTTTDVDQSYYCHHQGYRNRRQEHFFPPYPQSSPNHHRPCNRSSNRTRPSHSQYHHHQQQQQQRPNHDEPMYYKTNVEEGYEMSVVERPSGSGATSIGDSGSVVRDPSDVSFETTRREDDDTTPLRSNGMRRQRQQQRLREQLESCHENTTMVDGDVDEDEEADYVEEQENHGTRGQHKLKNWKKTSTTESNKGPFNNEERRNQKVVDEDRVQPPPDAAFPTSGADIRGRGYDDGHTSEERAYPHLQQYYPYQPYDDHQAHHHSYYYHSPEDSFDEHGYDYHNNSNKDYRQYAWQYHHNGPHMEAYNGYYYDQRRSNYHYGKYRAQYGSQQHPYELPSDDASTGVPCPPAPYWKAPYWYQKDDDNAVAADRPEMVVDDDDDGAQSQYDWNSSVCATPGHKAPAAVSGSTTAQPPHQVTPETPHHVRFLLPHDHQQPVENLGPGFDSAVEDHCVRASSVGNSTSRDGADDDRTSVEGRPKPKRRPALMSEGDLVTLEPYDVVCGRGAPVNYHPGNDQFRDLCAQYQSAYFCAKRSDKPLLAMKVLDILQDEHGARFVRRQRGNKANSKGRGSLWVVVSQKLAYEKVCEGLRRRDDMNSVNTASSSSSTFTSPKRYSMTSESNDVHMDEIAT